jgi:hypothetical protein
MIRPSVGAGGREGVTEKIEGGDLKKKKSYF